MCRCRRPVTWCGSASPIRARRATSGGTSRSSTTRTGLSTCCTPTSESVVPPRQHGGMAEFWLEPWDDRGPAFERRANTPEMQAYLGGVESEESIVSRHRRLLETTRNGDGQMFLIMVDGEEEPVGSVGYWDREWLGGTVYEMGWKVLFGFQG